MPLGSCVITKVSLFRLVVVAYKDWRRNTWEHLASANLAKDKQTRVG